jgi:hypothetical protein
MYLILVLIFAALAVVFYAFTVAEVRAMGIKEANDTPPVSIRNPAAIFRAYYRKRHKEGGVGWLPALTLASIAGAVYALLKLLQLI